eukprot:scaffold112916_cov76-Cyclotella_meneghiniana.AAC.4
MASLPPYALEVSPESSLQFSITQHPQGDGDENNASKCFMTLRHTGATKESLAFKVRYCYLRGTCCESVEVGVVCKISKCDRDPNAGKWQILLPTKGASDTATFAH